jgi:hypothetical protein
MSAPRNLTAASEDQVETCPPRSRRIMMAKPRRFRVAEIENALRKAGGICSDAARLLTEAGKPCSRQNVHYWVHKHVRLRKAVEDCVEEIKDLAESKLIENIRANDTGAIKFFLERRARDRGYGAHYALSGEEGQPIFPAAKVHIYIPDNGRDPQLRKQLDHELVTTRSH